MTMNYNKIVVQIGVVVLASVISFFLTRWFENKLEADV
jgi:Tfp pilus assembly protein PilW